MAINHNDRIIVPHIKQIDKEFWPLEVDHTTNPETVLVYFPRSPMIDPEADPAADGPVARACRRIAENACEKPAIPVTAGGPSG
jgi:hypothetical protein